ncbi:MAG: aminoacylase [Candidatus Scalindua sp.]|nr:D-aminoacylase [Planctomycetota bacterium]GJQ57312.1 MAG: aminoacylase [Candidatus Scalindua sp.]
MSQHLDLIIKNGTVVDGKKSASKIADIGIQGNKIAAIGKIDPVASCKSIDASGYIVSPGFIDIHSHSDFFSLVSPESESKIYDGVTTEICGNCGISAFPLRGQLLERRKKGFAKFGLDIDWQNTGEFFDRVNSVPSSMNRGFLVGHGNIRSSVLGYENREPDKGELTQMETELRDAMELGVFGMSSGLVYPSGCYAKTAELIELSKIVSKYNGIYSTHIRNEGDEIEKALNETLDIALSSNVRTQISHIKTWGEQNWKKIDWIEQLLHESRDKGSEISCDRYPYIASATDLDIILPNWVYEGGIIEVKKKLKLPHTRNRIIEEMREINERPGFWESITISSVFNDNKRQYEGATIAEIAKSLKLSPLTFVLDLLCEEECKVSALFFSMSEENLNRILNWDFVMVGSDSSLRSTKGVLHYGKPHPRCYGTFSKVIRKYVNDKKIISLEEAIHKMTALPAQKLRLQKRGVLEEGYFADITIFDQKSISDQATYSNPHNYSTGIKHVIVNGKLTLTNGKHTGLLNGTILRNSIA